MEPRRLLMHGKPVYWSHLKDAYKRDQSNPSLKIHEKLNEDHFILGYATRMRNHLAVNVLNDKILELIQV